MEYDPDRLMRVDIKRKRQKVESKINKRQSRYWEQELDDDDNEEIVNSSRRHSQNNKE